MTKVDVLDAFLSDAEVPVAHERVPRRRVIALAAGLLIVLILVAAVLMLVVPPVANAFADVFLFITRWVTGK
jgi:hypothetical protein